MEDKPDIRSCRIEFDNGVERETSIRYFVEMALDDPGATVFTTEGGEVTEIEAVEGVVA